MAVAGGDLFGSDVSSAGTGMNATGTNAMGRRLPLVMARSGRSVAFDGVRLAASIERARCTAGHDDVALSAEVADIAAFTLASRVEASLEGGARDPQTVEIEEIGSLVERVLVELGLARVAKEYILGRDRKARAREARGGGSRSVEGSGSRRLPVVRAASGTDPFDARMVSAALVEEAGLALDVAVRVAERVAETLAGTALRSVSTALIRELVSNELLSLGLQDALKRHEAVGVPRHDLRRDFEAAVAPRPEARAGPSGRRERFVAPRFEDLATASLLGRWSLEDVLPAVCAEAHRSADLHVVELAAPHRQLTRSVPVDLLGSGARWSRTNAFDLVRQVGRLAADVSHGVVLEDVASVVAALTGARSGGRAASEAPVVDLVLALGGVAAALGRDIGIVRFGGRGGTACGRVVRAIYAAERMGGVSLRAFATWAEIEAAVLGAGRDFDGGPSPDIETADAVEHLLGTGHLVPVWAPPGQRWVGPGCLRKRGERSGLAAGAAVALNLPRLARRAGPWREDVFLGLLRDLIVTATEALEALARTRESARRAQGEFLAERVAYAITPVGLVEALRILGDGVARPEQGQRILGAIHDLARRLGAACGLDVRPAAAFGEAAARRFARTDARVVGPGQPRLFADLPRPEEERSGAYSSGTGSLSAAHDSPAVDLMRRSEGLASLLGALPAGALLPPSSGVEREDVGPGGASIEPGSRRGGTAPGDADAPSGPESGPDSGAPAREFALAALCEDRPRFAAWSRFAVMRESGEARERPSAVNTLF